MYRYMIIYKKRNDDLIYRIVKTYPTYHKGDTTSMGWEVVDILKINNGKTYTIQQYDLISNVKYKTRRLIDTLSKFNYMKLAELTFFLFIFKNIM